MLEYVHSDVASEYHSILANVEVIVTMLTLFLEPAAISAESLSEVKESFAVDLPDDLSNEAL